MMPTTKPEPLGAKWTFPSNHLPAGAIIKSEHGDNLVTVVAWNVLHPSTLEKIDVQGDPYGLRASAMISQQKERVLDSPGRYFVIAELVAKVWSFQKGQDPRPIIALHDCNEELRKVLRSKMDAMGTYEMYTGLRDKDRFDLLIFDASKFELREFSVLQKVVTDDLSSSLLYLKVCNKKTKELFSLFSAKLADGEECALHPLVRELASRIDDCKVNIFAGDFGRRALEVESRLTSMYSKVWHPFFTHVSHTRDWMDPEEIFVRTKGGEKFQALSFPLDLMSKEVDEMVVRLAFFKSPPQGLSGLGL